MKINFHSKKKDLEIVRTFKNIEKIIEKNINLNISLVFVSESEIKKLNKRWREKNEVTDVLSFRYSETEGEIVICANQAKKQPGGINRVIIHGALHLMGYAHDTRLKRHEMRLLENKILNG
ncbi:MAG: rRNA maturation RNase YbeY [Patescibacteria group bacterium]